MASSEELLISRSSTFRSRRAFAASSFIASSALWVPFALVGLAEVGDVGPENGANDGDGIEAMLSATDAILTTRLSVFSGLGAWPAGSVEDRCFGSVTESIEDKLALLP